MRTPALAACAHAHTPPAYLQLVILNVEDKDFRDMLFDYRATQPGVMCVRADAAAS